MFKIAFMRAYYAEDPYQASLPPLGIGYLMSYLQKHLSGIDVAFCRTLRDVLDYKPDLLALSSATENFLDARENARLIKEELGIPVIGGGMHLTAIPQSLPKEFDYGSFGEGEVTFKEFVELLIAENSKPTLDQIRQVDGLIYHEGAAPRQTNRRKEIKLLDDLPYPARDELGDQWLKPYWQQVHMISSRGCPYDCSFCSSGNHWKGVRYFSEDYTATEIEWLRAKYNPREVYFFDDLMVANKRRFKRLCETFKERGTHDGVVFRTYARVDLIDDELADLFEEFNFKYIDFGFESNADPVLKYFNKRLVTPEINQRAIDVLRKRNVSVGANMIIGSPPETAEMARESLEFVRRNADVIERCSAGLLLALPGTAVWHDAIRRGLVSLDMDWSVIGFNSVPDDKKNYDDYPMMNDQMSRDELFGIYHEFKNLMREINTEGEKRYWFDQFSFKSGQLDRAKSEIESMRGSRVVQAALWLRGLRHRIFGGRDSIDAGSTGGNGNGNGNGHSTKANSAIEDRRRNGHGNGFRFKNEAQTRNQDPVRNSDAAADRGIT